MMSIPKKNPLQATLDPVGNRLDLGGEIFAEQTVKDLDKLVTAVKDQLGNREDGDFTVNITLQYFNSSAARRIVELLDVLDRAAGRGVRVSIDWHWRTDDENMLEFGEEFGEDIKHASFKLVEIS